MSKRKLIFNDMNDNIKRKIYEYDDTYKLKFKNVLSELIEYYNYIKENRLKVRVMKLLKDDWNSNNFEEYLYPKVNFNIIIKALREDIRKSLGDKNIKLILRSFCHYNHNDILSWTPDDYNMYPKTDINNNNGYNNEDTMRTIKTQIFNFLKDTIDNNKLEQFLLDFIDDNDIFLEDYIQSNENKEIRGELMEDENITYIFRNYDIIDQPHLYNYIIHYGNNYHRKENIYNIVNEAIKLYSNNNGLNKKTIQIHYNYKNKTFDIK